MQPGTIIDGKYEVVRSLGEGAFGAVYECLQPQFQRSVAVKILNTSLLLEPDGIARFEREAAALNALKHRNIIGIYGYGIWQQAPYMVMEFAAGKSLQLIVNSEEKLSPARAAQIMRQVFDGLGAAHAQGIIHRDLKPSNIMLVTGASGEEQVKLIDFGLAKLMPGYGLSAQKLTETGMALGTCHYMPPEQVLGHPVDARADIYAAGCIFYQLLSGALPFDADNNVAVMYKHLGENAVPVPLSGVYEPLSVVVKNCMAKKPEDRYSKCSEVIRDIDAVLSGAAHGVTTIAVAAAPLLPTPKQKRVLPKLRSITLGLLAACGIAGGVIYYNHQLDLQALKAELRKTIASNDGREILRRWRSGDFDKLNTADRFLVARKLLCVSPDAQVIVLISEEDEFQLVKQFAETRPNGEPLDKSCDIKIRGVQAKQRLRNEQFISPADRLALYKDLVPYTFEKERIYDLLMGPGRSYRSTRNQYVMDSLTLLAEHPELKTSLTDSEILDWLHEQKNESTLIAFCIAVSAEPSEHEPEVVNRAREELNRYSYERRDYLVDRKYTQMVINGEIEPDQADRFMQARHHTLRREFVAAKQCLQDALKYSKDQVSDQAFAHTGLARIAYIQKDYILAEKLASLADAENARLKPADPEDEFGIRSTFHPSSLVLHVGALYKLNRKEEAQTLQRRLLTSGKFLLEDDWFVFDKLLVGGAVTKGSTKI